MDTIFALATARGKSGVAVVRVSGPGALAAGRALAGDLPPFRHTGLRRIASPETGVIDDALVLCFEKGHSFTGEDVVEFHLHGSVAIVAAVLADLGGISGLRMAEPGEFTRRALENGCLDLAQVEGLGDLIEAETEAQRRQALKVFEGALGRKAEAWRAGLVRAVSLIEATIDFADEDVPEDVIPEVRSLLAETLAALRQESAGARVSERIRDGFEVAIVGAPNVGKSTLLNRLAGREAAITSEIAGTTRDVIEVRMDLGGLPVTFLDTAGIRETDDLVEELGVSRAIARAEAADLRIFLLSGDQRPTGTLRPRADDLLITGKSDITNKNKYLSVSGKTGEGVSEMIGRIEAVLHGRAASAATATRLRHRQAIDRAILLLESCLDRVSSGSAQVELASADIHLAIRALDSLIGRVDVEHILDEIFANFCLGK